MTHSQAHEETHESELYVHNHHTHVPISGNYENTNEFQEVLGIDTPLITSVHRTKPSAPIAMFSSQLTTANMLELGMQL